MKATHTPPRRFRCPDQDWNDLLENTQARGRTATEILLAAVRDYNARCDAGLEPLPPEAAEQAATGASTS